MPPERERTWICSQLGAREHYAIPRALHRAGRLRELHTDLWSSGPWQACRFLGAPGRDLAGRFTPDLPSERVRAYPWPGLPLAVRTRLSPPGELCETVLRQSQWLDREVARRCPRSEPSVFFGYTGAFLQTAERLRFDGSLQILGQIDPAAVEEAIVAQERVRWAGWEPEGAPIPDSFRRHRQAEWDAASLIVVNSNWARQALVKQGVPETKLRVVPLAYDAPMIPPKSPSPTTRLRILWLGQVILRKGIQYLCEAARLLFDEPVDFLIAGPIGISADAVASAPANVRFVGPVSRSRVGEVYADADVFVIPTLSDGFAITQLEAMAHGLPVIATPCCGEVVVSGRNGLIVPPADAPALATAITELARNRDLLRAFSKEARLTSRKFGLDQLGANLLELLPA